MRKTILLPIMVLLLLSSVYSIEYAFDDVDYDNFYSIFNVSRFTGKNMTIDCIELNGSQICDWSPINATGGGSSESPFTDVDNVYIYNDSGILTLNGTKLNQTTNSSIDLRVDDSFLQNLLDTVYASITYVNTRVDSIINTTDATIQGWINSNSTADRGYTDTRIDSIDNHTKTGNETARVDLIIGTYIPDNATADRSYTDTRVDSILNTSLDGLDIVNHTQLDNGTIIRSHNTTWVDGLIDIRVDLSFLQNILDSVYASITNVNTWISTNKTDTETVLRNNIDTNVTKLNTEDSNIRTSIIDNATALRNNIDTNSTADRTYTDIRVDSIDNHSKTGNETARVDLIIGNYIPDNSTADRSYTDTRVDSIVNTTDETIQDWINTNSTADRSYTDTRVDSIDNHTKTGNETARVDLIINTYIPNNSTANNAYTDTRVNSIVNTTDTRQTGYDYLYNDSTYIYLNESKLNETIDLRDNDSGGDVYMNEKNNGTSIQFGNSDRGFDLNLTSGSNQDINFNCKASSNNCNFISTGSSFIFTTPTQRQFSIIGNANMANKITQFLVNAKDTTSNYLLADFQVDGKSKFNISALTGNVFFSNNIKVNGDIIANSFNGSWNGSPEYTKTVDLTYTSLEELDIVNQTMLDNDTIIRNGNVSWIYESAPHTNLTATDLYTLAPHTNLTATDLYTLAPHTNLSAEAIYLLTPHTNATSSGNVTSSDLTNNAIIRGDGGANGIQDSGVLIDDSDIMTGVNMLGIDDGADNVLISPSLPTGITTGRNNVGVGTGTLRPLTSGIENMAIGNQALYDVTTGSTNVAIGQRCLYNLITGSYNVAIGRNTLYYLKEGLYNFGIGSVALFNLISGSNNVAIGPSAMTSIKYGSNNLAIGGSAGVAMNPTYGIITSFENYSGTVPGTVKANSAAHGLTTGNSRIIADTVNYNAKETITKIDDDSFYFTATWVATETGVWYNQVEATENTIIGRSAGNDLITGSYNVLIGDSAGFDIAPDANNQLWIDNKGGNTPLIFGDFSTGYVTIGGFITPQAELDILGSLIVSDKTTMGDDGTYSLSTTGRISVGKILANYMLDVDGTVNATLYLGNGSQLTGITSDIWENTSGIVKLKNPSNVEIDGDLNMTNHSITDIYKLEFSNGDTITGNGSIDINVDGETYSIHGKNIPNFENESGILFSKPSMFNDNINSSSRMAHRNLNNGTSATSAITVYNDVGDLISIGMASSNFDIGNPYAESRGGGISIVSPKTMGFVNQYYYGFRWINNLENDSSLENSSNLLMSLDKDGSLNATTIYATLVSATTITSEILNTTTAYVSEVFTDYIEVKDNASIGGYADFKTKTAKYHKDGAINTPDTNWHNITWNITVDTETTTGFSLSNDNDTIIANFDGIIDYSYCFHPINNGAAGTEMGVLSRLIVDDIEARCSQSFDTQKRKSGYGSDIRAEGTVNVTSGSTIRLEYKVDNIGLDFEGNSGFDNPVASSLILKKISDLDE